MLGRISDQKLVPIYMCKGFDSDKHDLFATQCFQLS